MTPLDHETRAERRVFAPSSALINLFLQEWVYFLIFVRLIHAGIKKRRAFKIARTRQNVNIGSLQLSITDYRLLKTAHSKGLVKNKEDKKAGFKR